MRIRPQLVLFLLLWPVVAGAVGSDQEFVGVIRQIVQRLEQQPESRVAGERLFMPGELSVYYRERGYRPAWHIDMPEEREKVRQFLGQLQGMRDEGLCSDDYHFGYFRPRIRELGVGEEGRGLSPAAWRGWDDVLLTDALMHYFQHLIEGRVPPDNVQEGWNLRKQPVDLDVMVAAALDDGGLPRVLKQLQPVHAGYKQLLSALSWYRELNERGGWPRIPAGAALHEGDADARLPMLRIRLMLSRDLHELPLNVPPKLLAADVEALKRFQRRHGLEPDGVLGERTLAELNVPVSDRLRQIELNLERWRWLPRELGDHYLLVNIADFRVSAVEQGKTVLSLPAVVGNGFRKTPVFSSKLRYIEFAPYWFVPPTILKEDKLPLLRKGSDYLERNHYELVGWDGQTPVDLESVDWKHLDEEHFPGLLRQKPGPWNPLGRVKFMLPNDYAVYLHDTPDRHLFWQRQRSFSSGCIRVQHPEQLAAYLLKAQGWDEEEVRTAMRGKTPQRVSLRTPLPVHVLYWTAWVDEDGLLHFRNDIYDRDADLDVALRREVSACRAGTESQLVALPPAGTETP